MVTLTTCEQEGSDKGNWARNIHSSFTTNCLYFYTGLNLYPPKRQLLLFCYILKECRVTILALATVGNFLVGWDSATGRFEAPLKETDTGFSVISV